MKNAAMMPIEKVREKRIASLSEIDPRIVLVRPDGISYSTKGHDEFLLIAFVNFVS